MINAVKQGYASSVANTSLNRADREVKTNESQKSENDKLSRIAEQIKKGEYKLDTAATAESIADSLL